MLALRDIREWVAGFGISEDSHVYIGKLDNKKERSIGVYRRKGSGPSGNGPGGRSTVQLRCPADLPSGPLGAGSGPF